MPAREALEALLREARGNVAAAARAHGWHETQVYRWIAKYGLEVEHYR